MKVTARPVSRRAALGTAASGLVIAGLAVRTPSAAQASPPPSAPLAPPPKRLAGITSWAYQLQKASFAEIASSPFDLVVIDSTVNGNAQQFVPPATMKRLQAGPGRRRRIVLAYLSVGEAEEYRFYWKKDWLEVATPGPQAPVTAAAAPVPGGLPGAPPVPRSVPTASAAPQKPDRWVSAKAPIWLGDENETWGGNFQVKYWDPDWQRLIFGEPGAFLERILSSGFDGIYLDRVDAYYEFQHERATAADDMADFVIRLAAQARSLKPDCIVVPQNAEELLLKPAYVAAIDGIAKEDLLYGSPTENQPNHPQQIRNSLGWLSNAERAGLPVMVIEYLAEAHVRESARTELARLGHLPYFGPRALDRLQRPDTPAEIKASAEAAARRIAAEEAAAAPVAPAPLAPSFPVRRP